MDMEEEKKTNNKKDAFRVAIISSGATLLLIIIVLLLVLLGLKQCSRVTNNNSSSSTSSEPTYNYDNELLNNQFIKIVDYERLMLGYEEAPSKVVAVSYTDNYPNSFSIDITAKAVNNIYHYRLDNYSYGGDTSSYDNCIGYISTLDITSRLDAGGSTQTIRTSAITNETIVTDKGNHYVISNADPIKYFSGFYLDNNEYQVYNYIEFTSGDNPFNTESSFKVNSSSPLYRYYQSLNI